MRCPIQNVVEAGDEGRLIQPLDPDTKLQLVAPQDIGAAAATALLNPSKWSGREVELAGDELTMAGIAEALGSAKGHEVRYEQVSWDQWKADLGDFFHALYQWIDQDGYRADIASLKSEGLAPTSLASYLSHA